MKSLIVAASLTTCLLAACTMEPAYQRPAAPLFAQRKRPKSTQTATQQTSASSCAFLFPEVDGLQAKELRRLPQLFFNAEQLIVLGNTIRP